MRNAVLTIFGLMPVLTTAAYARAYVVNDNGNTVTYTCSGDTVVVNGNKNKITLKGACKAVVVNGNDNIITVLGSLGGAVVNGNDNQASWSKAANPTRPSYVDNGSGNAITSRP